MLASVAASKGGYIVDPGLWEVLRIHLGDELYDDGIIEVAAVPVIARMGSGICTRTRDLFEIAARAR